MTTLIINVDDSQYAEGYMLIYDGTNQESFTNNMYTFWKFRFAEKALNFTVESGDINYNVSEYVNNSGFQNLQQVIITGGKEFIPDIAENISDYTACSFGQKLQPEPLDIIYDDRLDVIIITTTPTGRKTFADLGSIKFLNKKTERNFCDPTGL